MGFIRHFLTGPHYAFAGLSPMDDPSRIAKSKAAGALFAGVAGHRLEGTVKECAAIHGLCELEALAVVEVINR
jgi:hypothetical protein